MHNIAKTFLPILLLFFAAVVTAQNGKNNVGNTQRIWLDSEIGHQGDYQWKMIKAGDATDPEKRFRYPIMQLQIGCRPSFPEQF